MYARVSAALFVVAVFLAVPSRAFAEHVEWTKAVYAEVVRADHGGAVEQVPFFPYQLDVQLPQDLMRVSAAGTPGIVVVGGAAIGDGGAITAPTTP